MGGVMSKYINPFTDEGFKRIFGRESSKSTLIDFLNALLDGEKHIVDLTYRDKEQISDIDADKCIIYDIFCKTDKGENLIIEMQNKTQGYFQNRIVYYTARAITEQGMKGSEWHYELSAVYTIVFMNFRMSCFGDAFRSDVGLMERSRHEAFSDKMRMIFLQLPSFPYKDEHLCQTQLDRWIYLLLTMEASNDMDWAQSYTPFKKVLDLCELAKLSPDERFRYEQSLKHYRDNLACLDAAKQEGMDIGYERGVEQGTKQGIEKGISQGVARVAQRMLDHGLSLDVISKTTGLSADEIMKFSP